MAAAGHNSCNDKCSDDSLGYGELFAVSLARYPCRILFGSLSTAIVFVVILAIALSTSPEIFELDATEEGFKVADAPESLTCDCLEGLWSGDFSDDLPEPTLSDPPTPSTTEGRGRGANGRNLQRQEVSKEEQQQRMESMMALLDDEQKKNFQACAGETGRAAQQCRRKVLRSLPKEVRQQIRNTLGGGRGSGRSQGARSQAMSSAAGGALGSQMTSTSMKQVLEFCSDTAGATDASSNSASSNKSSSCLNWASLFAFRPYIADVYATKKLADDPTYWGDDYMGYGCCGVFAKEQRTWDASIDMLSEENIRRLRQFELEIRQDKQFKEFCYQDRAPLPDGDLPPRVNYQTNPDGVVCAYPFSITNFFFPSARDVPAADVDCKELHDAGFFCEYSDLDENEVELASDGKFRMVDGSQKLVAATDVLARIYTPDGKAHDMRPWRTVKNYLSYLWDNNLLDPSYRLLLDNRFNGVSATSRGLISRMIFEKPALLRPWMKDQYPELNLRSEEEWQKDFDNWLNDIFLPLLEKFAGNGDIDYMAYVPSFLDTWRMEGIHQAVAWSCGAIGVVFILLWVRMRRIFQTKSDTGAGWRRSPLHFIMSFVLPLGALFHVLVSFPVAWVIYRFVYQQKYVGYMQFISIFIIVGIGVDDVFVMFDAWMQSADEGWDEFDIERRMRFAWCRASRAMFITSVTDGLAFLANAVSVIASVRLFGYMIATMVFVNYILDVTLFPAALVLVTRWVHQRTSRPDAGNASVIGARTSHDDEDNVASIAKLRPRTSMVESFFQESFSPRLKKFGLISIGVTFAVVVGFAISLSQLKKSDRAFRFETFPDWFPMNRIFNMGNWEESGDIFGETTPVQPVFIIWGAKENGIDLSETDTNNPLNKGKPWLDSSFDLSDTRVQESIIRTCARLQDLDYTRNREVLCPLRHFKEWYTHANVVGPGTWPIQDKTKFMDYLKFFVNMPLDVRRCRVNRWGRGGYQLSGDGGVACQEYFSTGRFDRQGLAYMAVKQEYAKYFGFDGTAERISWHMIAVNTTLSSQSASKDSRAVYTSIQDALDAEEEHAVQASKLWPQMVTEEAMVKAAWQGALVSLGVAGFTLLAFTLNWILASLCLISIASIVTITLGFMPMAGWRFGFLEAMCMVFVVGFSVDFVAHLATAYNESAHDVRQMRATQALADIGVSIFWGMATTIAAGSFLIFCVMVPFSKMGIFLIWNQVVSFFFAVIPFSAALMILGPNAGKGALYCPARARKLFEKAYASGKNASPSNPSSAWADA